MDKLIISTLILLGSFFVLISAIGLLRFKDLYSRLHATTKATSFGLFMLLIGVSLYFNQTHVYIKALLIIIFIYLTAPLAAHSIAKSFFTSENRQTNTSSKIQKKTNRKH